MTRIATVRHTPATASAALLPAGGSQQYLTFVLGGEMFALGILNVKEIIEYGSLTPVPMMPPFIRGVINLRGAVVPVIDPAVRFGGQPRVAGKRSCNVIVEVSEGEFRHDIGIMVDAVCEVLEIPDADIEPPPAFGAKIRVDFIQGMGKINGRFVILLDIARVLSIDEIAALASVVEPGEAAKFPQAN